MLSTARDLAAWLVAQHDQGPTLDGTPLISPAAVTELRRPSATSSYALGWNTGTTPSGAPLVDHTGDLVTTTAYQALLPQTGYGIAVLANSGSQYGHAADLGARLVALVEGRPVPATASPTPVIVIEVVLLLLAAGIVVPAGRGVRNAYRWAGRRRSGPAVVLRLTPYLLPPALLLGWHEVVSFLYRGKDVSWWQAVCLHPAFTLLLTVTTAACLVVAATRLARWIPGRSGRRPPERGARTSGGA